MKIPTAGARLCRVLQITFAILFCLSANLTSAQDPIPVPSEIDKVTVFQNGAQITRTARVSVPAGNATLLFKNITQAMDANSIQLEGRGNLTILSISQKRNFLDPEDKSETMVQLETDLEKIQIEIDQNQAKQDALKSEKEMILANKDIGGKEGFSLAQLQQTADFFRKRLEEIGFQMIDLQQKRKDLEERKRKIQSQLGQERQAFSQKTSVVEVKVEAAAATTANFELTYLVSGAGWQSTYDARVTDLNSPVQLTQKARIIQQTGEDWKNVDLTLSTGNPARGGQVPYMNTWYVDFAPELYGYQNIPKTKRESMTRNADAMMMEADEEAGAPALGNQQFQVNENLIAEEYTIERRQTILSSGSPETVQLRELDLPAQYQYHIKPRLDKDAFLIAKIYNWDEFNLIQGELSLFNGATYVGKSFLNTQNPDDTLQLSMGRDQGIVVTRNRVRSKEEKSFLGGKKTELFTWKIEVRNTKSTAVEVLLKEPVPVSRNEDIEVEVEELSGGKLEPKSGIVKWEFELAAGAKKAFVVSYEIEWPKGRRVNF